MWQRRRWKGIGEKSDVEEGKEDSLNRSTVASTHSDF